MQQIICLLARMRRHEGDAGIASDHLFHLLRPLGHRVVADDHAVFTGTREDLRQCLAPVVAAGMLPSLKVWNELTHKPDSFPVHALHFRQ